MFETMKKIVIVALFCTVGSAAFATSQVPEVLVYGGTTNDLYTTPLESLFPAGSPKVFINKRPPSTACWRGYVGTWKIENDELYLVALREGHPRTEPFRSTRSTRSGNRPSRRPGSPGLFALVGGKVLMGAWDSARNKSTSFWRSRKAKSSRLGRSIAQKKKELPKRKVNPYASKPIIPTSHRLGRTLGRNSCTIWSLGRGKEGPNHGQLLNRPQLALLLLITQRRGDAEIFTG